MTGDEHDIQIRLNPYYLEMETQIFIDIQTIGNFAQKEGLIANLQKIDHEIII